ncbi:protein O-mannosyltransferase 1 [Aricia agestis]|uniref:protein O-mannosyltransferase 1 n=1 Tax=Aricia agestis TaxID=91739 RepID=UPI001C20520B|nr:protein O-mannosyltransferase 1 [Aricia agestis]
MGSKNRLNKGKQNEVNINTSNNFEKNTEITEKRTSEDREMGDGAPAECELKEHSEVTNLRLEGKPIQSYYLNIKIDVVLIALLLLALCTRLYNLSEPHYIVFDELHYGRYVSLYTKGVFFFDAHPPLGKQLLYLAGRAAGYDGNFTFDRIGSPYNEGVPVKALRLLPAISGSLIVPLTYQLMLEFNTFQWTAILAALLVLFENSFLTQSRFMLLESIQILFGMCGIYCVIKSTRSRSISAVLWLAFGAMSLGCCFSVKYSGLYTYYLAIFLVGRQMWKKLSQKDSCLWLTISTVWRFLTFIIIPLSVYVGVFYIHLAMLPKAGPHDSVMTSAFQATLQGGLASITRGQPLHVAHGSQITLRHSHGRTCWLHSHAHVYPVRYADGRGSSHQQQVTCYSFKDVNNWWIVKRPERAALAVGSPPDVIRHGDTVQLLHGITSRALNSHDVAAPVSPQSQEVSCYIDYNVSMSAQNLWRVEIVNREEERATWDGIRSQVRLVHAGSGAALRYTGRQLPAWGFHQHEVVADRALDHRDVLWNVEEHRYTKAEDRRERERELVSAEMIPTSVPQLSFWQKFVELQYKMAAHAADAPLGHMFASEPLDWPLLVRSIAYWLSPDSNAQVHLIGNLVTWYSGTVSVVLYAALLALYAMRSRRACEDLPSYAAQKFEDAGFVLFLGYWIHYLPYFFMDRTLFLHHYLPAYMFKLLLLAFVIDHIFLVLNIRRSTRSLNNVFLVGVSVWMAYILITFKKFSILSFGNSDLTETDLLSLRWKDTWDFILHKKG